MVFSTTQWSFRPTSFCQVCSGTTLERRAVLQPSLVYLLACPKRAFLCEYARDIAKVGTSLYHLMPQKIVPGATLIFFKFLQKEICSWAVKNFIFFYKSHHYLWQAISPTVVFFRRKILFILGNSLTVHACCFRTD